MSVTAVGLNFRDHYFVKGNRFRSAAADRIPCTDAVGMVTDVGSDVTRFQVGDRVCSTVLPQWLDGPLTSTGLSVSPGTDGHDGMFASDIQLDEDAWVHAPGYLSHVEAATLPVAALTAWHAVGELGLVDRDSTVVIQTTGGVAIFALQFAVAMGARTIVTSRSEEKLRFASKLGAWRTIDTTQVPAWDDEVLALTEGRGSELIIDMGLADSLRQSARAAAFEGTVAIIGVVQERTNAMDIFPVMNKNLRVRGVETGSRAMFERMNAFMSHHLIHPVIDRTFEVTRFDEALERQACSPFGKTVLTF